MNPDDIARILDELGERLGPSGEYVFGLAIRQVLIEGAIGAVLFAAAAVVGLALIPRLYRWGRSGDSYSTRDMAAVLFGALYGCLAGILFLNFVGYALPRLLNPEYAALTDILSRIVP